MNKVRLIIALIVMALLFIGTSTSYYTSVNERYPGTLRIETYIYKNGKLVYYDPDDPPVRQFMVFLSHGLVGTTADNSYVDFLGHGVIFITSDNIEYSYSLSTIPANRWEAQVSQLVYRDQEHAVVVSATIIYDGGGPVNITAYGLYTHYKSASFSYSYSDKLVFYDVLQQPLQVNNGDAVTVVYKVSIPTSPAPTRSV